MTQKQKNLQDILKALCCKITGRSEDEIIPQYKIAVSILGSSIASGDDSSEFEVAERIKKKLTRHGRAKDSAIFSEMHRHLKKQPSVIQNRSAVLQFLLAVSEMDANTSKNKASAFFNNLDIQATSTPYIRAPGRPQQPPETPLTKSTQHLTSSSSGVASGISSSGISTIQGSLDSTEPTPYSFAPSYFITPAVGQHHPGLATGPRGGHPTLRRLHYSSSEASARSGTTNPSNLSQSRSNTGLSNAVLPVAHSQARGDSYRSQRENTSTEVPETVLVRELVYALQGIECQYIQYHKNKEDGFIVNHEAGIPKPTRLLLSRLLECGWLYNKLRRFVTMHTGERTYGMVGQSFCSSIQSEIQEFHRLLAVIEAQLHQEEDVALDTNTLSASRLSLRKIQVWLMEPLQKFKNLGLLVEACHSKKGGSLASVVYAHMQHGDPYVAEVVRHALAHVAKPIMTTISTWIYDGELEDPYHEFFVAGDPTVKEDRLWQDKYRIRKGMVPSFLTDDQAKKILLSGKSINFLRQVCHDNTSMRELEVIRLAETHNVESMFEQDMHSQFPLMIDTVYKETSQHLLQVMHEKYQFLDHLKAMRRYLLLGQGDFIRHLMDLLEEDLAKPASELFLHNLTGILETAIRATNAQYDEPDILQRLDVRLLEVSPGDCGWDVFSLDYHVDGPIRTVFTPESVLMYLRVFNFLWRAKRMEYILAGIWKGQMSNAKFLRVMPEHSAILHQCHVLACEMVHFVQQVQYYINFEVMECSWDELLNKVQEAKDLDEIIAAHQHFLDTIITRSLLDPNSKDILGQLRAVFDSIITFQAIQDRLYDEAAEELQRRQMFEQKKKENMSKGNWGLTEHDEDMELKRRKSFKHGLSKDVSAKLRVHAPAYQHSVQKFLEMLAAHDDLNLRFLSFRLDFNEYYRDRNPKLKSPRPPKTHKRT